MENQQVQINQHMLALAREYRQITQTELAKNSGVSQGLISQIEGGVVNACASDVAARIAGTLNFPITFFGMVGERLGFGSSALFYRGNKKSLTAQQRRMISAKVNLHRLTLKRMLDVVDVDAPMALRRPTEETAHPEQAAALVRARWNMPTGAINNLTSLIEKSGVVIIECDFANTIAGTSMWLAELPPIIFIDANLKADRYRFTLAHELGHLVMHEVPGETMEDEADAFASALLLDRNDFFAMTRPFCPRPTLRQLSQIRPYWQVSIHAMIETLYRAEMITGNVRRSLYIMMSNYGIRDDAIPFAKERPNLWLTIFYESLARGANVSGIAELLHFPVDAVRELFSASAVDLPVFSAKPRLKVV